MKKSVTCDLRTCFMCQSALTDWLPAIASHKANFIARKGETIIREGDPVTGVYFVNSGNVKVHKKWGDKELIIRFANASKIFGHRGIGNKFSFYPISATALEETSLCFVPIDFFISTIKVNHDLAFKLLMFYADELQDSEKKMRELALMSVKGRLAVSLLNLRSQFGLDSNGCIDIELSRQDLAAYSGATYETVFRTMNDMVKEGLINLDGKFIKIVNASGLNELGSAS